MGKLNTIIKLNIPAKTSFGWFLLFKDDIIKLPKR